jgi:hypothetical protein
VFIKAFGTSRTYSNSLTVDAPARESLARGNGIVIFLYQLLKKMNCFSDESKKVEDSAMKEPNKIVEFFP